MNNQHDKNGVGAKELIEKFLAVTPSPTKKDWKQLIEENIEFSGYIADAALQHASVEHLSEDDVNSYLDDQAFNLSVSDVLNLVHNTPSLMYAQLEQQLAAIRGYRVRQVAADISLAYASALINSVLAGTVRAPRKLLERLANRFGTSIEALQLFLKTTFESQPVPSFKAENGKPLVSIEPTAWADAVRASKLTSEQTKELLDLEDEF